MARVAVLVGPGLGRAEDALEFALGGLAFDHEVAVHFRGDAWRVLAVSPGAASPWRALAIHGARASCEATLPRPAPELAVALDEGASEPQGALRVVFDA